MSERSVRNALLRFGALTTAVVLAFGGSSTALAQDDPTSTSPVPTETSTPQPPTSEPQPPTSQPQPEPAPPSSESAPAPTTSSAPPSSEAPKQVPAPPAESPVEAPAQDVRAQAGSDLKVTVKFDKREYASGEPVGITVTVRNAGDAPAEQIRFASEPWGISLTSGVNELISRPSLAPGESKTIKLGAAQPSGGGYNRISLTVRGYVEGATDPTPNDNMSRDEVPVLLNSGHVQGVLYDDKNNNGTADAGEGVAWRSLKLTTGPEFIGSSATTGSDGRFSMYNVPAGTYQARLVNSSGSEALKPGQFIVVKKDETTQVALQVAPALSQTLKVVGHSFDKEKYGRGDPIAVTVQLLNTGTAPINNVVAVCDPENDGTVLDGTGPGWGDLLPGRGISIAAGERKSVTVTDVVPDAAYLAGRVYFACAFSIDGRNSDGPSYGSGNPGLTVGAPVVGAFGSVTGRLVRDGWESVKIVAINPANNRILATYQSGGSYRFDNLPQGQVALKVVGRWRLKDGSAQRLVDVIGGQEVTADLEVEPGPEVADPSVEAPDLKLTVTFDSESYDYGDPVLMTIKVQNVGTGTGPVRGYLRDTYVDGQPYFDNAVLRKFLDAGVDLWPGESKEITLAGTIPDRGPNNPTDRIRYKLEVANVFCCDRNPADNAVDVSAKVTYATGSATVTVYGDRNLNGQLDAGEELANRKVNVGGGKPHVNKQGRTDASGKVAFTDLPAGAFWADDVYDRESGWIPAESDRPQFVVNPGDEGTTQIRLVRPLSDELKVSMAFDRPSYEAGAQLGLSVTITNNTAKPLQVKAECGGGDGPYLGNDSAGWGQLVKGGAGVLVEPGTTELRRVESPMPAESPDHGYTSVSCSFGPDTALGNPWVNATTKVPGATHTFRGLVVTGQWPNEKPVANVKLLLLDPDTGKPVARTVTDAEGGWVFPDLPVGLYTPLVVGPWRVIPYPSDGEPFANVRGRDYPYRVFVEPGPEVADPDGTGAGAGGAGGSRVLPVTNSGALANTGVSVLGLVLFGALLVMAGAAMRRRPGTA